MFDLHVLGKVVLVDLAGSEKVQQSGVEGVAFKEATQINRSLSTLSRVIECLQKDEKQYVPFRDSVLTMLLKDNLSKITKHL